MKTKIVQIECCGDCPNYSWIEYEDYGLCVKHLVKDDKGRMVARRLTDEDRKDGEYIPKWCTLEDGEDVK